MRIDLKRPESILTLAVAVLGTGLAHCSSPNNADAGRDVVTNDTVSNDVVTTEAGSDAGGGDVVTPTDVPTDAPACTATLPAMDQLLKYTMASNTVSAYYLDADAVMFGNPNISPFAFLNAVQSSPPDAMAGNCFYLATFEGSTARQMSPVQNRGTITMSQNGGMLPLVANYDATMGRYVFNPAMAVNSMGLSLWMPGTNLDVNVAGGTDGAGGMASLPLFPLIHQGDVTVPNPISRTADSTVTWTTPPGLPADQVALVFMINNSDFSDGAYCFAPACAHTMTIPSAITSHMQANSARQVVIGFPSATTIGPATAPINYLVFSGVDVPSVTGP